MWAPTLLYIVILRKTGQVDWGVVGSSYLGVLGVGAGYLAVGTLMSAMTRSQLMALLLTVLVQFGLFILGIGEYIFDPGLLRDFCAHVSVLVADGRAVQGRRRSAKVGLRRHADRAPLFVTVRVVDSWRLD